MSLAVRARVIVGTCDHQRILTMKLVDSKCRMRARVVLRHDNKGLCDLIMGDKLTKVSTFRLSVSP